AVVSVGFAGARRPSAYLEREERQAERADVGEHVDGIGHQREAVRPPAAHQLPETEDRVHRETGRDGPALGDMVAVGLHSARTYSASSEMSETTSWSPRRRRPPRNASSITNAQATTRPPQRRTSSSPAAAVPPVASRSSISRTRCSGPSASRWISSVSVPYSS